MKKYLSIGLLVILVAALMIGCSTPAATTVPEPTEAPVVEETTDTVESVDSVDDTVVVPTIEATVEG